MAHFDAVGRGHPPHQILTLEAYWGDAKIGLNYPRNHVRMLMDSRAVTRHLLESGPHTGGRSPVIWVIKKVSEDPDDWVTITRTEGAREYVEDIYVC